MEITIVDGFKPINIKIETKEELKTFIGILHNNIEYLEESSPDIITDEEYILGDTMLKTLKDHK